MDLVNSDIGLHAAPIVAKDVIIVGAAHLVSGVPKSKANVKGYVRGFDVRTGKRKWIFHTIPLPGEFGNDTWEGDSWSYTGNAGVWAQMSVDEDLGLVYLPVELPTGDAYGGHRPGAGSVWRKPGRRRSADRQAQMALSSSCTTACGTWTSRARRFLSTSTSADGRSRRSRSRPSRGSSTSSIASTGQPVWPIEERPVPKGDVPGEWYSPTQPFPTKPPAFDRQGVSLDDLIDFTPELKAEAVKMAARYKLGPLFTPPVVSKWDGPLATLVLPNFNGGVNWPGGSVDPETKLLYMYSFTQAWALSVVPSDGKRSDMSYISGAARDPNAPPPGAGGGGGGGGEGGPPGLTVQGLPLIKPPYGRITAIDLNKGEIAWQVAHGETPDNIKNNPALKGLTFRAPASRSAASGRYRPKRWWSRANPGSRRRRPASAARCCGRTTRRPARRSAPCTCRRRKPDRR